MVQPDAGECGEDLGSDVIGRARAGGGVVQRARRCLRPGDQLRHRPDAERGMHRQHVEGDVDGGDRHQVPQQRIGPVRDQRLVRRMGIRHQQQGLAIGCGLRHRIGADDRAAAGPVLDHHRLAERLGQRVGQEPRCDIGGAAEAEGHHDAERPAWPGRRRLRRGTQRGAHGSAQGGNRGGERPAAHGVSPCLSPQDRPGPAWMQGAPSRPAAGPANPAGAAPGRHCAAPATSPPRPSGNRDPPR